MRGLEKLLLVFIIIEKNGLGGCYATCLIQQNEYLNSILHRF